MSIGRKMVGGVARVGFVAAAFGGAWLFTQGSTTADALQLGDCFVMEDSEEIGRVDTPGCDAPHDSEVVGVVSLPGPDTYPAYGDAYWDEVYAACENAASLSIPSIKSLPDDAFLEMLNPVEAGWKIGERESLCVIYAEGGLPGSITGLQE